MQLITATWKQCTGDVGRPTQPSMRLSRLGDSLWISARLATDEWYMLSQPHIGVKT